MIQNLNGATFYPYGRILSKSFAQTIDASPQKKWSIKEYSLYSPKLLHMYQANPGPALIDILHGIGLLCISPTAETSEIQVFLLDKPVSIAPRMFFNVVPLYGSCIISVAHLPNYTEQKFLLPTEMVPSVINPKLSIEKIHTLFYQEKETGFHFRGEKHDFWELTYVDKGVLKTAIF